MAKYFEWPRGLEALRSQRGLLDKVFGILAAIAVIMVFVFLLFDIAYIVAIVAIFAGALIVYAGRGNVPIAVIGGIVCIIGIVDAILIGIGGTLAL